MECIFKLPPNQGWMCSTSSMHCLGMCLVSIIITITITSFFSSHIDVFVVVVFALMVYYHSEGFKALLDYFWS